MLELFMSFRDKVYQIAHQIPPGKVATYGQVAAYAGNPHAARAVGLFMKTNPFPPPKTASHLWNPDVVPCHRVVAADGSLRGYSGSTGLPGKKALLIKEGVKFKGEKVDLSLSLFQLAT